MGYYINPPNGETKEQFLEKNGAKVSPTLVKGLDFTETFLPVCLVDNGAFTAAGIAYSKQEAEDFLNSFERGDSRPYQWYLVSKEALKPYYSE